MSSMADDADHTERAVYDPAGEVVEVCRDLIRFDTSNYGDEDGPGERKAAEHVAALLDEVGIESLVVEAEPGRTNVIAQWGGTPRGDDGLLLHGHLDVVPAAAEDWQVHPFSGEIRDGFVWGRGAIDMKDFNAMVLSVVRARARAGAVPEAADHAVLHRRRGGRRASRRPAPRRGPRRRAGALHRGGGRGRRVQHQRPRTPPLPRRGGGEGDGVGQADGPGPRRARVADQPRQRHHRPDLGRRQDRRPRVAGPADADDADPARGRGRAGRHRGHA